MRTINNFMMTILWGIQSIKLEAGHNKLNPIYLQMNSMSEKHRNF